MGDYEAWLRAQGLSRGTVSQRVDFAERMIREWGTLAPKEGVLAAWLEQYQGWTRRTYVNHLSAAHRWMVETGQLDHMPLARYRRPRTPKPKPKPLDAAEVAAVLDTDDARLRAWLLLGLLAGLRAHEIAKVHGRDIDERVLFVRGKGGDESMIPTHPALWALAQQYPRDDFWFPSSHATRPHVGAELVSLRIRERFREVGVTNGAAHRLRYTYATRLADAGTPIRVVQELLRHRDLSTTMRYVAVTDDAMRAAIRGLAA